MEEYRKAQNSIHAGNEPQAVQHLDRAIELDQTFAEAWARKAGAHFSWGGAANLLKGAAAAEKAVALNPNLAIAHSMFATAQLGKLNWLKMDEERRLAVSLDPNSREILLESALNLAVMGKTNESLVDLSAGQL